MNLRRLIAALSPVDFVSILFLLFLTALNLVFHTRVEQWSLLVAVNLAIIAAIVVLAQAAERSGGKFLIGLHRWYCYPFIILVFKELYLMVHPIHPTDYDDLFIAIDRWMFGVDPTVWLAQFAHPVLTEILQIGYFSYYLLFIILGVELYRRYPIEQFDRAAFLIVYGFYLSYLGYFLLPAVGPRFTLHEFASIDTELPGVLLTNAMRAVINAGESIAVNHPNPIEVVQRDVFPSGHTQLTLVILYLAYHHRAKARRVLTILGTLLIIGTVYLRYHYVIDLVGGAVFFLFNIWSGVRLESWWRRVSKLESQRKIP